MKKIAGHWTEFASHVMPADVGDVQRTEMRRSFFAGAWAALDSVTQAADESGDDEEAGAEMLGELIEECRAFAEEVRQGKA